MEAYLGTERKASLETKVDVGGTDCMAKSLSNAHRVIRLNTSSELTDCT